MTSVHYRIVADDPHAHLFKIVCRITEPAADGQVVFLPAWIPGSYLIREFARHIVDIAAHDSAGLVALEKLDKATWRCAPTRGPLNIVYRVYAFDLSVRGAYLDGTRGFFNGTSVFLCARGAEDRPCTVEIAAGDTTADWRVATALTRDGAPAYGFGMYRADDYAELCDHPVELGRFDAIEFSAADVPHALIVSGRHQADRARLQRDLEKLCTYHIDFFGRPAPMRHYYFLVNAVGDGYGGLEHRASTALICNRNHLPLVQDTSPSDGYREFLGLCSHEYFHTWNVKRIKPAAFTPYDLTREAYTRQLWAFEGITSYYDDLALVRCGLISVEDYLSVLAQTVTRVLRVPGRHRQSIADASFDAWTKFYRADENAPNALVSYYTKGALVALALDLTLRQHGAVSLDHLMRALWQRYGDGQRGVPEGVIETIAQEIAGIDLRQFFTNYVYGTDDPPLEELLRGVGVEWRLRAAEGDQDKGGRRAAAWSTTSPTRVSIGAKFADGGEARLAHVYEGGAAHNAGLAAGDVLVACNGIRLTRANAESLFARYVVGTVLELYAFRRDELFRVTLNLAAAPHDTCDLRLNVEAERAIVQRREAWLSA